MFLCGNGKLKSMYALESVRNNKQDVTGKGSGQKKKKNLSHVTTGCLGNAFETDALDQSGARRNQGAANQRAGSEDLNQDTETENYTASFSITSLWLFVEAAHISKWLFE